MSYETGKSYAIVNTIGLVSQEKSVDEQVSQPETELLANLRTLIVRVNMDLSPE